MTNLKLRARRLCRDVSCVTYVAYLTVSSRDHYSRCLCLRNVIFLGRGGEKGGAHLTPHEISDFFVFLHTQFFSSYFAPPWKSVKIVSHPGKKCNDVPALSRSRLSQGHL